MTLKLDRTTVTYYNGLNTIGGNVIEVAYGDSHVFFDLGTVFRPELNLPDENWATLVKNQIIPDVDNLYDPKLTGKPLDESRFKHSAAYISHVHLDHSRMLNFLAPQIPLYAGPITAHLLPALNEEGTFLLPAAGHNQAYTRPIIAAPLKKKIQVGDLTLQIWPSDHDAYGATGLLIKTPDKLIAYTGDIRLHGYHPDWVRDFMAQAKNCDLLILEGTAYSWPEETAKDTSEEFSGPKNEIELIQRMVAYQTENPQRQLTFNTYLTNVERLLRLVSDSPRKVVLHAKRAALLKRALNEDIPFYYLPDESKISILKPELEISYDKLLADDHEYFWQAVAHFDQLQSSGLYIHSNAEPLGDFDPAYRPFVTQFQKHDIEFVPLRCSGHADIAELKTIISGIQPRCLTPVHTLHPELEENPYGQRILPKRGVPITLS